MTQINWGIASGPSAFDNALATGVKMGQAVRQQKDEREKRNALAAYAANPDDPKATQALVQYAPEAGFKAIGEQRERQEQAQLGQWTQDAMGPDPDKKAAAMQQLATKHFDRWKALDGQQREAVKAEAKQHGNAALYALQSPNPRAAVQAYAQQTGDPDIAAILQLPDDQLTAKLQAAVFEADLVGKLIELEQPKEFNIEPGGARYERDPRTGEIRTIVAPNYGGAPAFSQAPPKQTKQLGGKTYIQDANGDWYEDDGGPTQPASATFRP